MPVDTLIDRYMNNQISKSIVFGGLEPILQIDEILEFLQEFRKICDDDVVIYTGYYDYEIADALKRLKQYPNIVLKFGRFITNSKKHYDDVLGVYLSSDNQYAERIS
jgi:archaellum biogenesis ATPase FlaH